jgi:hypothetical protein
MKLGMLHLFENLAGNTKQEVIKERMELIQEAENFGFASARPSLMSRNRATVPPQIPRRGAGAARWSTR